MRAGKLIVLGLLALLVSGGSGAFRADDDRGERGEGIERIMKRAFRGDDSLVKKGVTGKASKAEQQRLLEMMVELSRERPPHGTMDSWKEKTDALVDAAKDLVNNVDGAPDRLSAASACKACHRVHAGREVNEKDNKRRRGKDDDD
jgi:hypothetical protein